MYMEKRKTSKFEQGQFVLIYLILRILLSKHRSMSYDPTAQHTFHAAQSVASQTKAY
jgi:hypothetical protein